MAKLELAQAREWSDRIRNTSVNGYPTNADCYSAAEIIQSLPDQWVDAKKVRDLIELYKHARDANAPGTEGWVINDLVIGNLEDLLSPKLPTLEDMNEDDRHALVGSDVKVEGWSSPSMLIAVHKNEGAVLGHSWINPWPFVEIRPLSELSPANGAVPTVAEQENDVPDQAVVKDVYNSESSSSETPKGSIKPSEVPPNEPWLIEAADEKAIGTRFADNTVVPWSVAALDGSFVDDYLDDAVTLIHKLVPEPPALPEGMRLADHEKYGRVVVSKEKANEHYGIFFTDPGDVIGAAWKYVHENNLTFLDGE